jgi:tetratricopeptide (TPR) repeat protein
MKWMLWMLMLVICLAVNAQDTSVEITGADKNTLFKEAARLFQQGKYRATITELTEVEAKLLETKTETKAQRGFVAYWKAICFNKIQDFSEAIAHFDKALQSDFAPDDLHYEFGQALFAADKLPDARIQFRESLKKKFKRGVSLYYIAYISKELGEKKKAVGFYKAIDKLDSEESKEVKQAAEMQIADIYLEQVEKHPDAFKVIESYVIPQYKHAFEIDKDSNLAPQIQNKILALQAKYDLVLFKLRNGRPTLIPPYFARLALEYGVDSNVTFAPTEQEVSESKKKSAFVRTDAMGKYTFYYQNFLSIAPEFRFNYTRYMNRVPEIYRNDNYLLAPAIRTGYEHTLFKKPASLLLDYDYNEAKRDVEENEELVYAFRAHTLMLGERFHYFRAGESTVRLRRRIFDSYLDTSDSTTTSFVFEQIISTPVNTYVIYSSYDMTRVDDNNYDTNSFTFRGDVIMARVKDWFTPSFGLVITRTNPLNNTDRGTEYMYNPSARLSKVLKKNVRGNLKFDYQDNKSNDTANFAYKKYTYSFELEYIF